MGDIMETQFKLLDWQIRASDGVVYAEPHGLDKSYFIYPPDAENEQVLTELVLIDKNGHYEDKETTTHADTQTAQQYAQKHYTAILKLHIL